MNSQQAVSAYFTTRFLNLYGTPDVPSPKDFIAEYEKALDGTDPDVLHEASDLLVRQHKYRNWPTVGECVEAVNNVAARMQREREQKIPQTNPQSKASATKESRERMAALVKQTVDKLSAADALPEKRMAWVATDRHAWEKRMQSSVTARWLSLPREYRESFGAAAEFERAERDRWPTGDE